MNHQKMWLADNKSILKKDEIKYLPKLLRSFTLWLFFSTVSFTVFASVKSAAPFFYNLKTANGLSHNKVNCILQDKRGFIWFGTDDGLNRYDGKYFTGYKNLANGSELPGNIITDLYEDPRGIIWIGTSDGGLIRYDYRLSFPGQFKMYQHNGHKNALPEGSVNKIMLYRAGNLWLNVEGVGVVRLNEKTGEFDRPIKQLQASVLSLIVDKKGTLWAGVDKLGLISCDLNNLKTAKITNYILPVKKRAAINTIFEDKENNLWFTNTDNHIFRRDKYGHIKELIVRQKPQVRPANDFSSITEDSEGQIWFASKNSGVTVYSLKTNAFNIYRRSAALEGTLANDHVNVTYADQRGIIWIGTNNGISVFNSLFKPFIKYDLPVRDFSFKIFDFYKVDDQHLWIATDHGIYVKSDALNSYHLISIVYKGQQVTVTKFFKDTDGTFYLGTDYTLFKYDLRRRRLSVLPNTEADPVMGKLNNSKIISIIRDTIASHPVLIVSSTGKNLTYYDFVERHWISDRWIVQKAISKQDGSGYVKKLYKDRADHLWMVTQKQGLAEWGKMNPGDVKFYTDKEGSSTKLSSNAIFDLVQDAGQRLWIANYGGGLNYFDMSDHQLDHIAESSDLTEGLALDKRGNIWMICNGHINKYDPFKKIYSSYDIPSLQVSSGLYGYIYKDRNNLFYAAGENAFIVFDPTTVHPINIAPRTFLTDFKIFNKSANAMLRNRVIKLDYAENYFSFEFSAPDFSGSSLQYLYKLEGVDKEWIHAGKRNFASYSNLSAGTYIFKVRASNWESVDQKHFAMVTLIISPPYWSSWWFYLLVIVLFVGATYSYYRMQITQLIKGQAIRNDIAKDLHDHIGSTLSSISVYSQVAKIYYDQHRFTEMEQLLETIGETAVEIVDEMADIVWAIDPQNDRLASIIQRIESYAKPICLTHDIDFSLKAAPELLMIDLTMAVRKNIFLILKESINNAIKYAKCKTLWVTLDLQDDMADIKIVDDGIGFNPKEVMENKTTSLSGNGLNNIRFRANELNGSFKITSAPGKGTIIQVKFKVS